MNREELMEQLKQKRLTRESITTSLIFDFYSVENEEKLIRGYVFTGEITHARERYIGKVFVSTKYKFISWVDGSKQHTVQFGKRKFSPVVKVKEGHIQLNNDVSIKIEAIMEFNVLMILLVDADKKNDAGAEYEIGERPNKFTVERIAFNNAMFRDSIAFESVRVEKYNSQFDDVWKYSGKANLHLKFKDRITLIMDDGTMMDSVLHQSTGIGGVNQKALHKFKDSDSLLLGYDDITATVYVYTNGIVSDIYALRFGDERKAITFGLWFLNAMKVHLKKNIELYFTEPKNDTVQRPENQKARNTAENTVDAEQLQRDTEKFIALIKQYPSCITDRRTFEAYISDVYPGNKRITFSLSALYDDGALQRLTREDAEMFIVKNQQILVDKYGIQEEVAYYAVKIMGAAKKYL